MCTGTMYCCANRHNAASTWVVACVLLATTGCKRSSQRELVPTSSGERGSSAETVTFRPGPLWPATVETQAPRGYHWETVRHETIHVRLLLPDGVAPQLTRGEYGLPEIDL